MTKLLYTIPEACSLLGISRSSMYRLVKANQIRSLKIGSLRRIPAPALQKFIDSQTKETLLTDLRRH
ncbi:MAG: helix-turn-helix domain-containing protein [Candidatus Planktophila sp.]|nr:helix-turn-helix domain-containing protein [Candidatus Planktophila sp.]